jgi:hypothetical protein
LFVHARAHADAAGLLNHGLVELPLVLSVLLEQERRIHALERAVDEADTSSRRDG